MLPFHRFLALAALVAFVPLAARAQSHEAHSRGYMLRSSTVRSEAIPASVARAHGLDPDPAVAILNVTVMRQTRAGETTVPAALDVRVLDLSGRRASVAMKEDRENGYVSYWGSYRRDSRAPITVAISATPEGSPQRVTLRYRTGRNTH